MSFLRQRMGQVPWRALAAESLGGLFSVTKWLCALQVTTSYVVSFTMVMGPSMLPTLNLTGDILVVNKIAKRWGQLNTGDVVLMHSPENPRKHIAKRILGVEGDTVTYLVDPENSDTSKTVVCFKLPDIPRNLGPCFKKLLDDLGIGDIIFSSILKHIRLVDPEILFEKMAVIKVPKGHIWIQGDNIHLSNDSRKFGAVPRGLVEGKVFLRVWPPKSIGLID